MDFTLYFLRIFFTDLGFAAPVLLFLVLVIMSLGFLIGRIEGWSVFDGLYHAFINATTVGYGDFRPTRRSSKLLALGLAFSGLIFTGMVVAIALHAANEAFGEVYKTSGFHDRAE